VCSVCSASVDVSSKYGVELYFTIVHKDFISKYLDKSEIRINNLGYLKRGRSQWPRGLRHRSACRLLAEISGSNLAGGIKFVCCEYCIFRYRSLCRAEHSSIEVLPIVLHRCV
jgi:hypothetical protein